MGGSENYGCLILGPYNKDPTIWGAKLNWVPYFRKLPDGSHTEFGTLTEILIFSYFSGIVATKLANITSKYPQSSRVLKVWGF